ncbi:MAG: hypothetical protein U0326_17425 [Polyangiales bacterium]
MLDILEEHRDEAAFLRLRRARLDVMLEGDARHERMLDGRLAAHLDALHVYADDAYAALAPWLDSNDPHERYVAVAALMPTTRGEAATERLVRAGVSERVERAVRDALIGYGRGYATGLVDAWLAEGDARHQAFALRVMARWGDARTEKIARRALRRDAPVVHRAAFAALAGLGARDAAPLAEALLSDCATVAERDDVLTALASLDRDAALALARAQLAAGTACGATGVILCGVAATPEDHAVLGAWLPAEPPDAAVLVALVLAGCHAWLDAWWAHSESPEVSNALREASYALFGDEVPPRTLGPRASEEPDERASRLAENERLRVRMSAVTPGVRGLWGARDGSELRAKAARLGPRHRAWATLACGAAGQPIH